MRKCQYCDTADLSAVPTMHIVLACRACGDRWLEQRVNNNIRGVYMGQPRGHNETGTARRPNNTKEECL